MVQKAASKPFARLKHDILLLIKFNDTTVKPKAIKKPVKHGFTGLMKRYNFL